MMTRDRETGKERREIQTQTEGKKDGYIKRDGGKAREEMIWDKSSFVIDLLGNDQLSDLDSIFVDLLYMSLCSLSSGWVGDAGCTIRDSSKQSVPRLGADAVCLCYKPHVYWSPQNDFRMEFSPHVPNWGVQEFLPGYGYHYSVSMWYYYFRIKCFCQ